MGNFNLYPKIHLQIKPLPRFSSNNGAAKYFQYQCCIWNNIPKSQESFGQTIYE